MDGITEEDERLLSDDEYSAVLDILIQQSRKDFVAFLHTLWPQVEGQTYIISKFHEHVANLIQDVYEGKRSSRQSLSVPPQHGKSRMVSVRAVAWLIGMQPGIHIAMTGFNFSLLADFLREVKSIINSPVYQQIFPGVVPQEGYNRQGSVMYSTGSSVQVTPAGAKLTGRRVDWLILDDPHAGRAEAESKHQRDKVVQWFYGDCVTRISPEGKVFLVSTRWHPDDLHGVVTAPDRVQEMIEGGFEEELFEVTNIPAIAQGTDPLGREEGEALFPEQRPLKFLQKLKIEMPGYEWESQYMGTPRTSTGDVVDTKKIKKIEMSEVPKDLEWYRGWDPAITEKTTSDYTAGALCALRKNQEGEIVEFYLIDVVRVRAAWAKMRFNIIETTLNDQTRGAYCNRIGIEAVAGFIAVYEDIKRELMGRVKVETHPAGRGGKLLNAQPWLNLVEAGRFHMVTAPWNKDFLLELEGFPLGKHDDQVDAISIAHKALSNVQTLLLA